MILNIIWHSLNYKFGRNKNEFIKKMEEYYLWNKKKNAHKWNIADTVTTMRMGVSVLLFFLSLETIWFFVIYTSLQLL